MQQVISTRDIRSMPGTYLHKRGVLSSFFEWCSGQEKNRFFWLGVSLMGSIATALPLTLLAIVFGANNEFALWIIACAVNVPVLIINLAAQPVKYSLIVMFTAWIVDLLIITYCGAVFFGLF